MSASVGPRRGPRSRLILGVAVGCFLGFVLCVTLAFQLPRTESCPPCSGGVCPALCTVGFSSESQALLVAGVVFGLAGIALAAIAALSRRGERRPLP